MSTTTSTVKNKGRLRNGLSAKDVMKIGKKANELKAQGATVEERVKSAREMARQAKIDRAIALWRNGYSIQEIAETISVAESTVRYYLAHDEEVIDLNSISTLTLRIREYKREGLSNVAIGHRVGVSESTVRRRLKTPLTEEETLLEAMYDELANSRQEIVDNVSEHPLFRSLFGDADGKWMLRVTTTKRLASFRRRDGKGQCMSFTLEFSAYRQPLKTEEA
jgi:transposase